ncbi:MAG: helix-hairpin-helix domain-containing protein [Bacteroidetes bacterium]|nr:helix-hairpin-helix domain-containing protein [Bacteroidota bacterium]
MKGLYSILLLLLLGFARPLSAQIDSSGSEQLNQQIENLSETLESEDADFTNLIDNLAYYAGHPINLNTASREELEDFGLLSDIQISNLLTHIARYGNLISIYELQAVDGFDLATIYKILPYVKVDERFDAGHFSFSEMMREGRHEFVVRGQRIMEEQLGYTPIDSAELAERPNARYLGSPYRIFTRYRFTYSRFVSVGMIAEKDAGEEFFTGTQKQGFDFYAGHICIRNIGIVKTAVAGDYQVSFGQGLTAWTGFAFGKTPDALNIRRAAMGIRPYISSDENRFLRGSAVTLQFGKIEVTAFGSIKRRDANVTRIDTLDTNFEITEVSSLQTFGLHSTPGEVADKDALREDIGGGNVTFRSKKLRMGVTGLASRYSATLSRNLNLYNQFEFSARTNTIIGADYDFLYRNFHFFGEAARSANGSWAFVNGVTASLDPKFAVSLHTRWFGQKFQNLYGNVFAEGTTIANERGVFLGMQYKPSRRVAVSAYMDRFRFPWLRFNIDAPSGGSDFFAQINFTPDKKTDIYFRYRRRDRSLSVSDDDAVIDYIGPTMLENYRFNIQYPVGNSFKFRNRLEFLRSQINNGEVENGFIIWQDITYKQLGKRISFTARYALFQTDNYFTRVYAYESDMIYAFSIPSFSGRGSRVYALINWDVSRNFEIWVRAAQTFYKNQEVISEGSLNEIQGNTRTEVKVQVRFKF